MSKLVKRVVAGVFAVVMVGAMLPQKVGTADIDEEAMVETVEEPTEDPAMPSYGDPNNSVYPYSLMSADWGEKIYEQGFKYYQIPETYVENGGCFPEVVQVYLWNLCKKRGLDYYTMVALIERESGYRFDAIGDAGNSFGYTQIYKRWHLDRMAEEGAVDLLNPYSNLKVCTNFLAEIHDKYGSSGDHCELMVYNMGEGTAKKLWDAGVYSSEYSRGIMQRAQEIKQELQAQ